MTSPTDLPDDDVFDDAEAPGPELREAVVRDAGRLDVAVTAAAVPEFEASIGL